MLCKGCNVDKDIGTFVKVHEDLEVCTGCLNLINEWSSKTVGGDEEGEASEVGEGELGNDDGDGDEEGEASKVGDCRDDEDDGDGSLGEASEAGGGDLDGDGGVADSFDGSDGRARNPIHA